MGWPTRPRLMLAARIVFLVGVCWFISWGLRGRGDDVRAAVQETPLGGVAVGLVLVVVGLFVTGLMWQRILRGFGYSLSTPDAAAIFFVGQLGKYLPGSVWTFGAQADQARRHDVPVRVTLASSLVFLGVNVATAAAFGCTLALLSPMELPLPSWVVALVAVGAAASLLPAVVTRLAARVAGRETPLALSPAVYGVTLALMVIAWACYAGAVVAVTPDPSTEELVVLAAAYLIAYAAGVLVFLAPAGLGAREATFVLLAEPTTGLAVATSVAILARVLNTVGDVALAGLWSAVARSARSPR